MASARLLLLAPLLVACANRAPRISAPVAPAPAARTSSSATSWDTTWYVTSRARRDGRLSRAAADSLEFGFVVTRFRERTGPGSEGPFVEGVATDQVESRTLSRAEFSRELRNRDSAAAVKGVGTIVYVHGYAVSFSRAIRQAADIAHRGSHRGPMVAFVWPAHNAVVAWPAPSALVTRAYRDDSVMAIAAMPAFRDAISAIRAAARPSALTVVGHSLGSRLVAEGLATPSALREQLTSAPLASLVLFAPDIALDRFRDSLAAQLRPVATRRIVYASDDDLLMTLSRVVNGGSRAGQATAARALASSGVELIDVTKGRRVNGFFLRMVEPGHGMRFASTALVDFFGVVRGVPADCRETAGFAAREETGVWRLTEAVPPHDASFPSCSAPSPPRR